MSIGYIAFQLKIMSIFILPCIHMSDIQDETTKYNINLLLGKMNTIVKYMNYHFFLGARLACQYLSLLKNQ